MVGADLPTGGKVQSGQATMALSGSSLTVSQASSKLVVDWDGFSVGQGNKVQFIQPSSTSVVLNRVVGADPSVIRGSIQANGQVFLVNTNGVFFTSTSRVDVGGLVASTLSISDDDFLAGRYRFASSGQGSVINEGSLNAPGGFVAMIAAKVG